MNGTKKLSRWTKIAYAFGDVGSQFVWTMVSTYLTVFYTDVVGITPVVTAAIMLGARIWDGINDPMFGAIAERTRSRWGRFRPYILFCTPLLVVFNVLVFINPWTSQPCSAQVIYAAVTYVILGMLYTAVSLSYGSLAANMTYDIQDRNELASYRMIGSQAGMLILNAASMPAILAFSGNTGEITGRGYLMAALLFSLIAVPMLYLVFAKCKEVVVPVEASEATKVSLGETLKVIFTNKPLILLFLIMLLHMFGFMGRMSNIAYYFIYVLKNPGVMAMFMTAFSVMGIVGILVCTPLVNKIGHKKSFLISFGMCAVCLIGMYLTPADNIPVLFFFTVLMGFSTFAFPLPFAMVPNVVDYAEDKTGIRADGTSYAIVSLATKFAQAFGGACGLVIMNAFGYVANAEQTAEAIKGINIAVNLAPAIAFLLALIPVLMYPLNEEKNKEIAARLQAKRAAAESDQ